MSLTDSLTALREVGAKTPRDAVSIADEGKGRVRRVPKLVEVIAGDIVCVAGSVLGIDTTEPTLTAGDIVGLDEDEQRRLLNAKRRRWEAENEKLGYQRAAELNCSRVIPDLFKGSLYAGDSGRPVYIQCSCLHTLLDAAAAVKV